MIIFFSPHNVAIVFKYNFDVASIESMESESSIGYIKKRKLIDPKKFENIFDYSQIKLPALMFLEYLQSDVQHFISSCLR